MRDITLFERKSEEFPNQAETDGPHPKDKDRGREGTQEVLDGPTENRPVNHLQGHQKWLMG